jgi:hypothetical protein
LVFCAIFVAIDKIFSNQGGSQTWKRVYNKDAKIDFLIIGNSHSYNTLDSEILSKLFAKNVYTIGSSMQAIEMTREYLRVILKYKKPQVILIPADSLSLERLKYDKSDRRIANFLSGTWVIKNRTDRFRISKELFSIKNILTGNFQLLNPVQKWNRFKHFGTISYTEGQYGNIRIGGIVFQKDSLEDAPVFGKSEPTQNSLLTFEQIIKICEENDIELWIYFAPEIKSLMSEYSLTQIHEKYPFVKYADDLRIKEIQLQKIGLTISDYTDTTHLNKSGMVKASLFYAKLIQERLGWKIVDDNFFAYAGESIEKIGENKWRYTMKNMQKDVLYKFTLLEGSKVIQTQDFSKQNYFDCPVDILENPDFDVRVIMLPVGTTDFDDKIVLSKGMTLLFMKYHKRRP